MTHDQLVAEKHTVQKALLHYERNHGRPVSVLDREKIETIYLMLFYCSKILTTRMQ